MRGRVKLRTARTIMSEILTIAEIESRYPDEWLLLDELETTDAPEIKAGRVLFHSKDRDEVYRKAMELRPKRFATFCTGTIPDDAAVVL